jgi:hypothetical protein
VRARRFLGPRERQRGPSIALRDANHPAFLGAVNWATNHGYGKAKESLEVSGPEGEPVRHVWMIGGRELVF